MRALSPTSAPFLILGALLRGSRALRSLAWGAVVVGVAAPLVRHRLRLRAPVVSVLSWQAPLALALAAPRSRLRDAGIYAVQMWAYFAHYDMVDDDGESLDRRLKVDYPAQVDKLLGLGTAPTVRLQRLLGRPGTVRPHDIALSCVHWSWFFVPHSTLAYVLIRRRELYPRSAAMMAAVFDLGCIVYWVVPTAPPWWAGEQGRMPKVRRIMVETGERVWKSAWSTLYTSLEGNPVAAMPSLHFGTSVMAARILSTVGRREGMLGWSYAGTLGFGLVYLGEHYLIDLIAGGALAEAVFRVVPRVEPWAKLAAGGVTRFASSSAILQKVK
jgi:membrane-associated phospholipid phosphatase